MIKFNQKLKSTDGRKYFITSDLHFFHKSILKFCPDTRPWSDVEEMNEALIEHWNNVVGKDDVVFSLGDFSFKGKEATQEILDKLNGHIVFVLGNHCVKAFSQLDLETHHYLEIKYDDTKVCMMHYPLLDWNRKSYGSVALHGHLHGASIPDGMGWLLDVGWDAHGKILELGEAIELAKQKQFVERFID